MNETTFQDNYELSNGCFQEVVHYERITKDGEPVVLGGETFFRKIESLENNLYKTKNKDGSWSVWRDGAVLRLGGLTSFDDVKYTPLYDFDGVSVLDFFISTKVEKSWRVYKSDYTQVFADFGDFVSGNFSRVYEKDEGLILYIETFSVFLRFEQ